VKKIKHEIQKYTQNRNNTIKAQIRYHLVFRLDTVHEHEYNQQVHTPVENELSVISRVYRK